MTNQATGTGVLALAVKEMVNEPVPGTAAATPVPLWKFWIVASTRLDGPTPGWLTVTLTVASVGRRRPRGCQSGQLAGHRDSGFGELTGTLSAG